MIEPPATINAATPVGATLIRAKNGAGVFSKL
jgi:hypothetical protein